ncbi:kinase A anchor protein [Polychytrium aggregatum]|uniref:kinase A anchor protein n=1 Tax=Polychytrium aggregatum TaxID=110093 RepID=UPI0022FE39D7|nr:kinase A anchor protein [Polychytrium aggregatum]KAI9193047.1 kinase A anchor protein [Polychytrium aggregatum]
MSAQPQRSFHRALSHSRKQPPRRPSSGSPRPNHFVSIRLNAGPCQEHFAAFYQHVTTEFPELQAYIIPPSEMHLTLALLHLNEHNTSSAIAAFAEASHVVRRHFSDYLLDLEFGGIDTFRSNWSTGQKTRVVYTYPKPGPSLSKLASFVDDLSLHLASKQSRDSPFLWIDSSPDRARFTPHCTLMKLKRTGNSGPIPDHIPDAAYSRFQDFEFGSARIASIELSIMMGPKESDGYYRSLASIPLPS